MRVSLCWMLAGLIILIGSTIQGYLVGGFGWGYTNVSNGEVEAMVGTALGVILMALGQVMANQEEALKSIRR